MANTGYQISPTVRQYFTSGPDSGSVVTASFDQDLTVAPFSASLNDEDFFFRAFDPIDCEPGFEDCQVPILTSLNTGSRRGRFTINYLTASSYLGSNDPLAITASISNDQNFGTSEVFSSSIGEIIPVTTSFVSGTVYFKAFASCSGPDQSPDSAPLSFTYDLLPPPLLAGSVNIIFKNNLSSAMEVDLRSTRGNANYKIAAGKSITYDYSTSPDPGAWTSTGRSEDLSITIKGGSRSAYGNFIQRTTLGIEKETYTTGGGYDAPTSNSDNSSTFTPDKGVTFNIRQLVLPKNGTTTTTTFTLLTNTPPPPPPTPEPDPGPAPGPPPASTPYIQTVFGSTPYSNENSVCATTGVNYREKTYFKKNGYLYNSRSDALDNTRATFPNVKNYILTSPTVYLIVNEKGYIQNRGGCALPSISIYTLRGSFPDQESACKRNATSGGSQSFSYKDNRLQGSSLSGRYPLGGSGRGGRNIILSAGRIVGYETCGTELSNVQYGSIGYNNSTYPLNSPSSINPRSLNRICGNSLTTYKLGPSGTIYYATNPYIRLGGSTGRWFKTTSGTFVRIQNGSIIDTASPC
jgi:hypothetical protein